jgi:hypothetical protein
MYVREKKIRRGEKVYSYWQVVQGTRVDGGVRQAVVKHLGPLPDRGAAMVVAKMWGYICGEEHCTREGEEERPMRGLGKDRRKVSVLLCSEHAEQASTGGILSAVALDREWREL